MMMSIIRKTMAPESNIKLPRLSAWCRVSIVVAAGLSVWLWVHGLERSVPIAVGAVIKEQGFAFVVTGIDPVWPLFAIPDSVEGGTASGLRLYENGKPLGPAHTSHATIRGKGAGAYSHWNGRLYFSTSDNSDVGSNHRHYVAVERAFLSFPVAMLMLLAAAGVVAESLRRSGSRPGSILLVIYRDSGLRWIWHNAAPGLAASAALVAILVVGGEVYVRATLPFTTNVWPSQFRPDVGFTFKPHSIVRLTNFVDFWTEERTNRNGFLDREPPSGPPEPGVCRVVFIGDSFVEAAQVPIMQKFHLLFKRDFNAQSIDLKVDTIALGFSGAGQLNEIPFYDVFARPLRPRVVVLVIVGNDLANNSALLESMRNGWHAVYSPRLFAKREPKTAEIGIQDIAADWQEHALPTMELRGLRVWNGWHRSLIDRSVLYRWLFTLFSVRFPATAQWISGEPSYGNQVAARIDYLRRDKDLASLMDGWDNSTFGDLDGDFFKPGILAPAFQEAVEFSDFAFAKWVEKTKRDGVKLLAMTTQSLATGDEPGPYMERVRKLLVKNGIDEIDQLSYARSRGHAVSDSRWSRDGHWNKLGHRWVADQLIEYFVEHPNLCRGSPS
jgi:hypothetical protein